MTGQEFNEAKKLWKAYYASSAFAQAISAAKYIGVNQLEHSHPLFGPLVTALHISYARPFTMSDNIGSYDERIVPPARLEEHKVLMTHRHELHAHRDGQPFQVPNIGAVNQCIAVRDTEKLALAALDFYPRHTAMARIASLIETVKEVVDNHVGELWQKYHPTIPAQLGEYSLNVSDRNGPMWIAL